MFKLLKARTVQKINYIKNKNGIKAFGCKQDELIIFTKDELKELNDSGLISDGMYHIQLLVLGDDKRLREQLINHIATLKNEYTKKERVASIEMVEACNGHQLLYSRNFYQGYKRCDPANPIY